VVLLADLYPLSGGGDLGIDGCGWKAVWFLLGLKADCVPGWRATWLMVHVLKSD